MKSKVGTVLMTVFLACGISSVSAQERGREPRFPEAQTPEKIAIRTTDMMNKELQLTDKQYKKIYKLNLKEEKQRQKAIQESGNGGWRRPPMGGGRPGMGGGPGMGAPGMDGPDMGTPDMNMGEMGQPPVEGENGHLRGEGVHHRSGKPAMAPEAMEALAKQAEKKDKSLKKILSPEQYELWQRMKDCHRTLSQKKQQELEL